MSEPRDRTFRPPLSKWHLKNFKSVADADIEFYPLTVMVGPNSSGKSTLIQSILAMAQASKKTSRGGRFPLNGGFVGLGNFVAVRRQAAEPGEPVEIGFELNRQAGPRMKVPYGRRMSPAHAKRFPPRTTQFRMALSGDANSPGSALITRSTLGFFSVDDEPMLLVDVTHEHSEHRTLDRERVGGSGTFLDDVTGTAFWVERVQVEDAEDADFVTEPYEVEIAAASLASGLPVRIQQVGDLHQLLIHQVVDLMRRAGMRQISRQLEPEMDGRSVSDVGRTRQFALREYMRVRLSEFDSEESEQAIARLATQCAAAVAQYVERRNELDGDGEEVMDERELLFSLIPDVDERGLWVLSNFGDELEHLALELVGPGEPVPTPAPDRFDNMLEGVTNQVTSFLSEFVDYLGPIRQEPQVAYKTLTFTTYGLVGSKGEYTAAQLHDKGDQWRVLPMPPTKHEPRLDRTVNRTIKSVVNEWLDYICEGHALDTAEIGRAGLDVMVTQSNLPRPVSLDAVGFGLSQLWPIVALCMLAEEGSVLMFEQPELHLHPAAQQRLAEFFVAVTLSGRQVIVETHSEYLVNRLRLLVARSEGLRLENQVGMLFVNRKLGVTNYQSVPINEFGGVDEWPEGFFDQSASDARQLLRASMERKARGE